jgi:hypothetical protein
MPALLLHMTLARELAARPGLPPRMAGALSRAEDALLVGSILPDLPYHARFGRLLVLHLLGKDYLASEWGDIFHTRGTGRLALALLAHARRSHPSAHALDRLLAFAAGYLCHHAVDRVAHPAVQSLVARLAGSGGGVGESPTRAHTRIERYQSLLYHADRLGEDLAAGPYGRRIVSAMAGAGLLCPRLPGELEGAIRAACLETHGRAPSTAEVSDWLFGVTAYARLVSSRLGRTERLERPADEIRRRFYSGGEVDLERPLARALELSATYLEAAEELLELGRIDPEGRATFLRRVPDVDLGTGG